MFSIKLDQTNNGSRIGAASRAEAQLKTAYSVYWYPGGVACIIQCRLLAVKIPVVQLCGIANAFTRGLQDDLNFR